MPDLSSQTARVAAAADSPDSLPEVRLEMRQGSGRSTAYVASDVGFLIGTVPGCDLRVPGAGLPPVLCLITRRKSAVTFRKLAPTQIILVNGQTAAQAILKEGDRLTIGAVDLFVHIEAAPASSSPAISGSRASDDASTQLGAARAELQTHIAEFQAEVKRFQQERQTLSDELRERTQTLDQRNARLDERQKELDEQTQALQADRVLWYQRREEIQKEFVTAKAGGQPSKELETLYHDLEEREKALASRVAELGQRQSAIDAQAAGLDKEKEEIGKVRHELAEIRRQLYERYQERRDRLAGLQEAIQRAARKVQDQKRQLEEEMRQAATKRYQDNERQAELDNRAAEVARLLQRLDKERQHFEETRADWHIETDRNAADFQTREQGLAEALKDLEKRQQQHQSDLVRLDRFQATLDERDRELQARSREIEQRFEQFEKETAEIEEQVAQIEEWRVQLGDEAAQLAKQKEEQEKTAAQLAQRAAALEGQQATVAALRTRLERLREEARREEQVLAEERGRQQNVEAELSQKAQELDNLRSEVEAERQLHETQRQQHTERSAVLEAAVNQLRQAQQSLSGEEEKLRQRVLEIEQKEAAQVEQEALVQGRLAQIEDTQQRLEAERQALRERTQALAQAEQVREQLQEQLRRRSEELAARQRELAENFQRVEGQAAVLEQIAVEQQQAREQLAAQNTEIGNRMAELQNKQAEHQKREETLQQHLGRLQEAGRNIVNDRNVLKEEQEQLRTQEQALADAAASQRAELETMVREARELLQQLPDLELRAGTALERLTHARDQLRDHLGEIHAYARQCQDDLEALHARVEADADRQQQHDQALRRLQDEHRLAVADFRQQLIDWQAQIADKKRLLTQDETRLERKQAQVIEQAKKVDAGTQKLAEQVEQLQEQERAVAGRREEIDRHLADMREWYRKKLRELAGVDERDGARREDDRGEEPAAAEAGLSARSILSLPIDEADSRLGNLLQSLGLVDGDTLNVLLGEARRQRRSLRQVLLAGGVVTLYQMALIEAGNIDALMLGPVRMVDRLRATPHETIYRVFDPRCGQEATLRHLSEAEMQDAVHPDEYRQRFTQAQLSHPHLARTLEVLEIAGRPAVLQEWLNALACADWPPLASVPGVCFRLLTQAGLGLSAAHEAGLIHGHLSEQMLFLAKDGTLKICGLGEPAWLTTPPYAEPATIAGDLAALGKIAAGWSTSGVRKGSRTKPLPEALLGIISRLNGEGEDAYTSAVALLEDLDRVSSQVPANAEAWDRLVKYVREHAAPEPVLRQSA